MASICVWPPARTDADVIMALCSFGPPLPYSLLRVLMAYLVTVSGRALGSHTRVRGSTSNSSGSNRYCHKIQTLLAMHDKEHVFFFIILFTFFFSLWKYIFSWQVASESLQLGTSHARGGILYLYLNLLPRTVSIGDCSTYSPWNTGSPRGSCLQSPLLRLMFRIWLRRYFGSFPLLLFFPLFFQLFHRFPIFPWMNGGERNGNLQHTIRFSERAITTAKQCFWIHSPPFPIKISKVSPKNRNSATPLIYGPLYLTDTKRFLPTLEAYKWLPIMITVPVSVSVSGFQLQLTDYFALFSSASEIQDPTPPDWTTKELLAFHRVSAWGRALRWRCCHPLSIIYMPLD